MPDVYSATIAPPAAPTYAARMAAIPIGHSLFLRDAKEGSIRVIASRLASQTAMRFKVGKVTDGMRVWRVK